MEGVGVSVAETSSPGLLYCHKIKLLTVEIVSVKPHDIVLCSMYTMVAVEYTGLNLGGGGLCLWAQDGYIP